MLRFAHIDILWGLLVIPVFILLFLLVSRWKKKALASFGQKNVVRLMIPQVSFSRPWLKFIFFLVAYASLIVGMADPQLGSKTEEVKRQGADIMILLDVSNSMLARDLVPSRLENAKQALAQLIDKMHDDRIGIIVFAGQAYVQLPITTDYSAAKLFLNTINTNIVPVQGTAIGAAIDLGMKSFDFKSRTGKAMIIITDGENHEDNAIAAAESAKSKGVTVNVIGLGSPDGSPIPAEPENPNSTDRTDKQGIKIITKLNEGMCRDISTAGGGVYVHANNSNSGLGIVMDQIGKIQRKLYDSKTFKDYEDRFQFFLAITLVLLVVEFFISNRKNMRLSGVKLFEVKKS